MGRFLLILVIIVIIAPFLAIAYSGAPLSASPGLFTRIGHYLTTNEASTERHSAWPEREPLMSNHSPERVYEAALATADAFGWRVLEKTPSEGKLHAIAYTPVLRFKDDVYIRVATTNDQRVVVRVTSASRLGSTDFGRNSARLKQFRQALARRL